MELAAQQFMRALRGKRSQQALARRLGYRGNPLTDWEHGRRYPTAREALRAASVLKVDVAAALVRFAPGVSLSFDADGPLLGAWLAQLGGETTISELAQRSGLSRFAIGRWLAGQRHPRLPDFLRLVDAMTGRLPDLVAELVPIADVPALATRFAAADAARRIAFEQPWTEAVLRVLETESYRTLPAHRPGVIAARLGVPLETEQRALAALEAAQLIRWDGARYGDLRPITVDTRGGREALHALRKHWALVAAERAGKPLPDDFFSYNLFSASAADYERIRELMRSAFREIRAIVAASEPPERIGLINMQLLGWNEQA